MFLASALIACLPAQQAAHSPFETRFDAPTLLYLKQGTWDAGGGVPHFRPELRYDAAEAQSAGYYLAQDAPARLRELRERVQAAGGRVFDYVPNNAWEVWLPAAAAAELAASGVRLWPVEPALKLSPEIGSYGTRENDGAGRLQVSVEYWPDRDLIGAEEQVRALGVELLESFDSGSYLRSDVLVHPNQLLALARLPEVKWIEEDAVGEQRNDKSQWVIQTNQSNNTKLWNLGVTGRNVTIGIIDGGRIHESSCYFDDPSGVAPGTAHRKIKWWSSSTAGIDSHHSHTAGSAAGDSRPINGSSYRNGMAPDAYLASKSGISSSSGLGNDLNTAHSKGARIHTNSWGSDGTTSYNNWCRDIDNYSHTNEDGVVMFAVTNTNSLKNPENAKSCVGVGATDRTNPENHGSGGQGPTADGRLKPEVYAPGCSTFSAHSGQTCGTRSMCGTSMASPVVAGAAALVKQYFEDGYYPTGAAVAGNGFQPSGSLLRAMLAISGDDMSGVTQYPGYKEGWGRILLDNCCFFGGDSRKLFVADKRHAQGVSAGQSQNFNFTVSGGSNLRVFLAFADEPGSAFAAQPVVNNLNLTVTAPDGTVYHGNILSTATSTSTANATQYDPKNTMEAVLVPSPQNGTWSIQVTGADVPVGPQGFAVAAAW